MPNRNWMIRLGLLASSLMLMASLVATPLEGAEEVRKYFAEPIYNEQGQVVAHRCSGDCLRGGLCCSVFPNG
jgi:hypothetical protein